MKRLIPLAALALATTFSGPLLAQDEPAEEAFPSPNQIVEQASDAEWVGIDPEDLLVMDLLPDSEGNPRRVVIQLVPAPFSQGWVGNIRTLAKAHWWDGTQVYRVQDNYVVQWGDVLDTKDLPDGLNVMGMDAYTASLAEWQARNAERDAERQSRQAPENGLRPVEIEPYPAWHSSDAYAQWVDFYTGWPVATSGYGWDQVWWPTHCYGAVGVARGLDNTGTGAELYTVIGHAPRHLDRNIAVVGRVIEGIEHLSSLPRGDPNDLGFYQQEAKWVPILSVRLGNELEEDPTPEFEYLSTESETFARYADARANRRDPFFKVPAGGADICNIPVPIRRVPAD
jgi:peptidylprolyl isomerase